MKTKLTIVTFLLCLVSYGQITAFKAGEKLTYSVAYEMSGLMTKIAQINMSVSPIQSKKGSLYRLKSTATTYKNYDDFFKIRDFYESYVYKKSLRPISYTRKINEGGYQKTVKNFYNLKAGVATSKFEKKNNSWKSSTRIPKNINDVMSALYYMRAINLNALKVGNVLKLKVIFDGKVNTVNVKYLGKQNKRSKALGTKSCHKLALSYSQSTSFSGVIWMTADKNKIPVVIEAKIPVGKGKIELKSATGINR